VPFVGLPEKESGMTNKPQDMITDWQARISLNQKAHWVCLDRLEKMHFVIGLSTIILSTLAGTTLLVGTGDAMVRVAAGSVGLLAAVLSGIQTFYNYARRSGMHRAASTQLSQLKQQIEALDKLPPRYLKTQTEILLHIDERLMRIEETSPAMDKVMREIRGKSQSSDVLVKKMKERK